MPSASLIYREFEAGFHDRMRGLAPQSADDHYFAGYCEAIQDAIAAELQREIGKRPASYNFYRVRCANASTSFVAASVESRDVAERLAALWRRLDYVVTIG